MVFINFPMVKIIDLKPRFRSAAGFNFLWGYHHRTAGWRCHHTGRILNPLEQQAAGVRRGGWMIYLLNFKKIDKWYKSHQNCDTLITYSVFLIGVTIWDGSACNYQKYKKMRTKNPQLLKQRAWCSKFQLLFSPENLGCGQVALSSFDCHWPHFGIISITGQLPSGYLT